MTKPLLNITVTDKHELDQIVNQYQNGGKALSFLFDYEQIMRSVFKHGEEQYLAEVQRILKEDYSRESRDWSNVDMELLGLVAFASADYFRSKYYSLKQEYNVEDEV